MLDTAANSGARRVTEEARFHLAIEVLSGRTPVPEAKAHFEQLLDSTDMSRIARASLESRFALLHAMEGQFDQARRILDRCDQMYRDLGARMLLAEMYIDASWVERLAGNLTAEVDFLTRSEKLLRQSGAEGLLGYVLARRAVAVCRLGRWAEARRDLSRAELDVASRSILLCHIVRGRLMLEEGDGDGAIAEMNAAEAVSFLNEEFVNLRAEALIEIATVTFEAGQADRADKAAEEAIRLADLKGNVALRRRAAEELARFRHEAILET